MWCGGGVGGCEGGHGGERVDILIMFLEIRML
jgi:hypothetical protein